MAQVALKREQPAIFGPDLRTLLEGSVVPGRGLDSVGTRITSGRLSTAAVLACDHHRRWQKHRHAQTIRLYDERRALTISNSIAMASPSL
jgi:hypothetical protein